MLKSQNSIDTYDEITVNNIEQFPKGSILLQIFLLYKHGFHLVLTRRYYFDVER